MKKIAALIFALGLVLLAGCDALPAVLPVSTEPVKAGTLLFQDDFSDPASGWGTWERENSQISYEHAGLRIFVNEPQFLYWSLSGKNFQDARIEVDAITLGGPDDNSFGIICRFVDKSNFYGFILSSDGYYGIFKLQNGSYNVLGGENKLQYSQVIRQASAGNHIQAECNGSQLTLSVNGKKLAEAKDDALTGGGAGLIVGTYDQPGADVLFDNFALTKP